MNDLYLASGNLHKLGEFQKLDTQLPLGFRLRSARDAGGMPEVDENADTFLGNAALKARALMGRVPPGSWVLADDSGLCVDALGGAPGIRSARYAGMGAGDAANLAKLLREVAGVPEGKRGAHFVCALVLLGPGEVIVQVEGKCAGRLLAATAGSGGFGYDPAFVPEGQMHTFAELGEVVKNSMSHRARAWQVLVAAKSRL